MIEPERSIQFRVVWHDRNGDTVVNRGWRIQFNSAIGPYKGGLRFHPTVDEGVLKFLGFEQTFKNALTGLPMGGGKGGSDFDPRGKTDAEVRDFCVAFMTELSRHIGENTDVPAGDINVGAREIGFLYGAYKRLKNETVGVLTGKGLTWGGSEIRPEATGYGVVYLAQEALRHKKDTDLKGKRCVVSGCGNVAQHTMEKLLQLDAVVLGCSDSKGCLLKPSGLTANDVQTIKHHHNVDRKRLKELELEDATYFSGDSIWNTGKLPKFDLAFPCATQNELEKPDAENLVSKDVSAVIEGANMPCTRDAVSIITLLTLPNCVTANPSTLNRGSFTTCSPHSSGCLIIDKITTLRAVRRSWS
eukprot:m.301460 g.301460  ORF g.301460 m.301460 type:complete len:359 (+) comp20141_c0_seq9:80-1156(+)